MDFLNGRIRPIYVKYLAAAFGGAGRRRAGVEYHIQPGPPGGHRRQRDLQRQTRQRWP